MKAIHRHKLSALKVVKYLPLFTTAPRRASLVRKNEPSKPASACVRTDWSQSIRSRIFCRSTPRTSLLLFPKMRTAQGGLLAVLSTLAWYAGARGSNLPPEEPGVFKAEANATIDAPIDAVWHALLDFPSYPDWNPFVR